MNKEIETYKSIVVYGSYYQKNYFDTNIYVDFEVDEVVLKSCSIYLDNFVIMGTDNNHMLLFKSDLFDNNIFHHDNLIKVLTDNTGWELTNIHSPQSKNNIDVKFNFKGPKTLNGSYRFYVMTLNSEGQQINFTTPSSLNIPVAFTFEFRKYKNNKI